MNSGMLRTSTLSGRISENLVNKLLQQRKAKRFSTLGEAIEAYKRHKKRTALKSVNEGNESTSRQDVHGNSVDNKHEVSANSNLPWF